MFSPLAPDAGTRSSTWRSALKRSADRALAFVTLEGYDTDDVRERLHPEPACTSPDLLEALLGDAAGAAPRRTRPTDPHRRPSRVGTAPRRAGTQASATVCTAPVAPRTRA